MIARSFPECLAERFRQCIVPPPQQWRKRTRMPKGSDDRSGGHAQHREGLCYRVQLFAPGAPAVGEQSLFTSGAPLVPHFWCERLPVRSGAFPVADDRWRRATAAHPPSTTGRRLQGRKGGRWCLGRTGGHRPAGAGEAGQPAARLPAPGPGADPTRAASRRPGVTPLAPAFAPFPSATPAASLPRARSAMVRGPHHCTHYLCLSRFPPSSACYGRDRGPSRTERSLSTA
jgi:hypothetical protein